MKTRSTILAGIAAAALLFVTFAFTACPTDGGGNGKTALATPTELAIEADTFTLKWAEVPNAESYTVEMSGFSNGSTISIPAASEECSLFQLTSEMNIYTIKVRANAGNSAAYSDSAQATLAGGCEVATYVFETDDDATTKGSIQFRAGATGNGNTVTITGLKTYGKTLTHIVIPEKIKGKDVTEIGEDAFADNTTMESVVISKTVTKVGKGAFKGNTSLETVKFLRAVDETNDISATEVEDDAFEDCNAITDIFVPEGSGDAYGETLGDLSDAVTEVSKELVSINVTTPPSKTTYSEGEKFSANGMVVKAKYNDNSEETISLRTAQANGYTMYLLRNGTEAGIDTPLITSDKQVTVSYTESGETKTTSQAITVNPVPVTGNTITINGLNGKNGVQATVLITDDLFGEDEENAPGPSPGDPGKPNIMGSFRAAADEKDDGGVVEPVFIATGTATIATNGTLTVQMKTPSGTDWNASGKHFVVVQITYGEDKEGDDRSDYYLYTNGTPKATIENYTTDQQFENLKYTFGSTSIGFDKFILMYAYRVDWNDEYGLEVGEIFVRTVTITGITGKNGHYVDFSVFEIGKDQNGDDQWIDIAMGVGTIANGSVTIPLLAYINDWVLESSGSGTTGNYEQWKPVKKNLWNGTGSYLIQFYTEHEVDKDSGENEMGFYVYTNSNNFMDGKDPENIDISQVPKYAFTASAASIAFNRFTDFSDFMQSGNGDGPTPANGTTITITGFDEYGSSANIYLYANQNDAEYVAKGSGSIQPNKDDNDKYYLTVNLSQEGTEEKNGETHPIYLPWNGNGSYYIKLDIQSSSSTGGDNTTTYFYTGSTATGTSGQPAPYNFDDPTTYSIPFNDFAVRE